MVRMAVLAILRKGLGVMEEVPDLVYRHHLHLLFLSPFQLNTVPLEWQTASQLLMPLVTINNLNINHGAKILDQLIENKPYKQPKNP